MNMKNFKIFYLLIALSTIISCTDDLNVVSEDPRTTTPEALFSSFAGYKQALAGVYGNLSLTGTGDAGSSFLQGIDAGTSQFGRTLWYLQNLTADEVVWTYENDEGVAELQRNTWTANNPVILGFFSRTMAEVAFANDFLRQSTPELLASRGITNANEVAEINVFRGEVRVLRALAYYYMMDVFGKAPFITESNPIGFKGPEYNREQLFNFIESELTEVLPTLKDANTNEYGRLDKAVAQMILAKVYLNAEVYIGTAKYTECMTQCQSVMAGGYTLNTNYLNNFKADNHTSNEMIFTLQADGVRTQNYGATTVIINGQVGSFEGNGSEFGVGGWGGALRLRKQLVQKFDGGSFSNDVRNTITDNNGSRPIDIAVLTNAGQGHILHKFSNKTSAGVAGPNSTFVDTDFPLFRLADVYLMYAEAQMRKDGATNGSNVKNANTTSIGYINDLRVRANNGSTSANVGAGDVDLQFIIDERARELHWEGHRRQDLIRFGQFTGGNYNWAWKGNIQNGTSISDNLKVFPIPSNSIVANPNLTQNQGY
ncbi:RagB/SusD family nutrient uptake outer membrane protein [Flavobacterium sp. SE-s27]|uniref:RagB/SusD family nutrient uptake outer membrane protein n=2 Tax=Flavobacterium solisilvae TaxID=1852019 RepID=A0ABX1QTB0_9FLAO|nr:RagB/SusD family nutrient uptake outer membrane protein [Flavobacterium solisilvae]